jgi:hypothetical protein
VAGALLRLPPAFPFPLGVEVGVDLGGSDPFPRHLSQPRHSRGIRSGRCSTSIPHDVDFRWDPVTSGPCGPNLHQGVANVFRYWDFYPVLAGEVECGGWV